MVLFPQKSLSQWKVELWMSADCSCLAVGALGVQKPAPAVLRKIKTFRGANEFFGSAFVSSINQSPQVTVSAQAHTAALSLQKAQIQCMCCVCMCCFVTQTETIMYLRKKTVSPLTWNTQIQIQCLALVEQWFPVPPCWPRKSLLPVAGYLSASFGLLIAYLWHLCCIRMHGCMHVWLLGGACVSACVHKNWLYTQHPARPTATRLARKCDPSCEPSEGPLPWSCQGARLPALSPCSLSTRTLTELHVCRQGANLLRIKLRFDHPVYIEYIRGIIIPSHL